MNHTANSPVLRSSIGRQFALIVIAVMALLCLPCAASAAEVSWIGETGDWDSPSNWSTGAVPGEDDDVVIDKPGIDIVVTHSTGTHAVKSLRSGEEIVISGGKLVVSTTLQTSRNLTLASDGILSGGTVTASGGGQLIAAGGTLEGVTLAADMSGDHISVEGGLTLGGGAKLVLTGNLYDRGSGTQTFGGNGEIVIDGGGLYLGHLSDSTVTVIGPQVTVRGWGGIYQSLSATLVNYGTISVEGQDRSLALGPFTFANHGVLRATGGASLFLSASNWTNHGVITVTDSSISLGGAFTQADLGNFDRSGSTVNLTGKLAGGLALTAETGSWNLASGSWVQGGTIMASGGAQVVTSGCMLEEVTLATNMSGSDLLVMGSLTLSEGAKLTLTGLLRTLGSEVQTFGGNGEIILQGGNLRLDGGNDSSIIIGPQVTVRGWGVVSHVFPANLINDGTIIIEGQDLYLNIQPSNFTNNGVMRAISGVSLHILAENWTNQGTITVEPGATLSLGGVWNNAGIISVTDATVNLGGTFSQASLGTFEHAGGTVNLTGTLTGGLVLSPETGSWNLGFGGRVQGGTITASGGEQLIGAGGMLEGVTLATDVRSENLSVYGGLTFSSGAKLTLAGPLYPGPGVLTFDGSGEIILEGNGIYVGAGITGDTTVTVGPGVTVRGWGSVSTVFAGNLLNVINEGIIIADAREQSLSFLAAAFTNHGVLRATGGAQLVISAQDAANHGPMSISSGSTIDFSGLIQIDDPLALSMQKESRINVGGNLVGNTRNVAQHTLNGAVNFVGSGTLSSPQLLEVMSRDAGPETAGFAANFAIGSLVLKNNTHVRLIDQADNAAGAGAEALYLNSLAIEAGSTLHLNGLKVYARTARIEGTLNGTTFAQIPDSGLLEFDSPTPGTISVAGELDEWTFFGRAGQSVTVVADIAGTTVVAPALVFAHLSLLGPQLSVLAESEEAANGASVTLADLALPADGVYRIRLRAPSGQPAQTGNYRVAVWNVVLDVAPLVLNQQHLGQLANPYSVDRWTFTAAANQQVRFDLVNTSSPGAVFTLRGPGNWTGFEDLTTGSGLITLPATGNYTLTARGTGGAYDIAYVFRLVETAQTVLALGTLHTANLAGAGQAQLFRLDVMESAPLRVFVQNAGLGNRVELYVSRGVPPTRESSEYQSASGSGASRSLLIPSASAGPWYVLVYADHVGTPGAFTIQGSQTEIALAGVTPGRHATNVAATLTLSGAGFAPGTTAELVSRGGVVYPLAGVSVDSFTQLTATLAANTAPAGTYALRVHQPGGAMSVLEDAFTVIEPGFARLQTRLIMPGSLGLNAVATLYVEYSNTGTASMPAPLLIVQGTNPNDNNRPVLTMDQSRITQSFWFGTESLPPGTAQEVLILASGAQPGILNPGERFQVPVYYLGIPNWDFSDSRIEMEIRYWTADNSEPIDWAARKDTLRPPTLDAATWDVVYANLTAGLGTTADYVRMLSENAQFLGRLGLRVTDVGDLWNFEVQQAYGYSALPVLDEVTDSAVATPGVGLDLTRRFSSNLRSRQASGPFGRGWFTPWQSRLLVERGGDLLRLVGEAGSARVFSRDTRNNGYFSQAGDSAKLVASGGGYQLEDPNGTITRFRADGRIDYVQDANGNRVTAAWNGAGQLTGLTHSAGGSITLTYNGAGLIGSVTNSAGRSVTYTYNGQYLQSATTEDGKITGYTYDTAGAPSRRHVLTSVTRGGATRHFTWDARGRLESSWLAAGEQMTVFGYDSAGGVTVSTGGGTTSLFFEHRGLLAKSVDPLGNITTSEFDTDLRLRRLVLPTGDSRSFTWCNCGSPTSITDELGHTTRFRYEHPLKKMTHFTDAKGNLTRYIYDVKGNLLDTTYADGSVERLGNYTAPGLPQAQTNRRSQVINTTWTPAGQIDRKTFADGSFHDFDYDTRGNLVRVTEHPATGPDKITTYAYSPASDGDRLKKVTYPNDRWVEYFYDSHGRRSRIADSAGGDTRYDYDAAARLWKVSDAAATVLAEYLYDAAGRLLRINKGNGTYTTYEYDAAGQILELINHAPNGTPNSQFIYTYDTRGRRTSMDTLDGKWTYTYDATGQLTRAVLASTNPEIAHQDLRYNYDALGNRISTVLNGVTTAYTANNLNQYTDVGGTAHQYDADGNLISDGERTYVYNVENRLVQVTGPEGVTQYEYDALGNRTATVLNGERTEYLLDLSGLVHVVAEYAAGDDSSTHSIHGAGLLSRITSEGAKTFFDYDALGSTVNVTSISGVILNRYAYSPSGGTLRADELISNPLRFVGQFGVREEHDGRYYMRERYYSETNSIFTSSDPIRLRGGSNYYTYADNNPINNIDPRGLFSGGNLIFVDFGPPGGEGCGSDGNSEWVPDRIGFADFSSACKRHDDCYGVCGVSKASCDARFFFDIWASGFSLGLKAQLGVSAIYGGAVTFLGKDAYDAAQEKCNPPPRDTPPEGGGDGKEGGTGSSSIAFSADPNEKIGPTGYGAESWIQADSLMPYRINFENLGPGSKDPDGNPYPNPATAPAQRVVVTDPLSASLDWSTFQFTEFGFGDTIVPVPYGSSHFTGSVPMTYNDQTFDVEIEAGIDFSNGVVTVRFQSIDPETSLPPDVLTGLLPPEDGTGRGMGHVSFTVRSRADLPTGTAIRNVADIKFDINEVIATDQVDPQDPSKGIDPNKQALVTLDADAPASTIGVLPGETSGPEFLVSWSGSDAGSGIAGYDVYVSENGGEWELWQAGVTVTSAMFTGQMGRTYGFISVARDHTGNVQPTPAAAQATTTVGTGVEPEPPVLHITAVRLPDGATMQVTLTYDVLAGYTYTVETSDTLGTAPAWQPLPAAPHQTGTVIDSSAAPRRYYRLQRTRQP